MSTVWDNTTWNTADSQGQRVGPPKIGRPKKKKESESHEKSEIGQIESKSIDGMLKEVELHD
tara:strand:+ start:741 stop:926 length:186 start_codon:yes stop_codon:yes gene_type:complete